MAALDDGGLTRVGRDLRLVVWGEAGRADHMNDAGLGGEACENRRGFRAGKIDHRIDVGEEGHWIVGDGHATRFEARELAIVVANIRRALGVDPAGDHTTFRLAQHARERLAHAASGTEYSDPHCSHDQPTNHHRVDATGRPRGMKPDAKKAFYAAIGLLTSPCLKRPA